jgi:hypothetical protein
MRLAQSPVRQPGNQMKQGSLRDALDAGDSPEHKALLRAIAKANSDRERAILNVCRLSRKGAGCSTSTHSDGGAELIPL